MPKKKSARTPKIVPLTEAEEFECEDTMHDDNHHELNGLYRADHDFYEKYNPIRPDLRIDPNDTSTLAELGRSAGKTYAQLEARIRKRLSDAGVAKLYPRTPARSGLVEHVEWTAWLGDPPPERAPSWNEWASGRHIPTPGRVTWRDETQVQTDERGRDRVPVEFLCTYVRGFGLGVDVRARHFIGSARRSRSNAPWITTMLLPHVLSQGRFTLRGDVVTLDEAWLRDLGVAGHMRAIASIERLVLRMRDLAAPILAASDLTQPVFRYWPAGDPDKAYDDLRDDDPDPDEDYGPGRLAWDGPDGDDC